MNKRLYVTLDTEMDADIHWKKMWPPEYSSIYEGIPNFYRPLWNKYNVHPIYFLSPEILMDEKCCEIMKKEIELGAIIGAHLHPEYIEPQMSYEEGRQMRPSQFPNRDYSKEIEKEKLKNLTKLIEDKLGVRPIWYRAARFGADEDTYSILNELGYKYDSSVTPGIDWSDRGGMDYSDSLSEPYKILDTEVSEMPVTIDGKRFWIFGKMFPNNWLLYRWLRPTHMTYVEMKHLLQNVPKTKKNSISVMMFHSMEIMINKTPYVRNKLMQSYYLWRLNKILSFASKNDFEM